jgi:hypothetical protein
LDRSTAMVVCFSTDSSFRELLCDSTPRWPSDAVHAVGGVHLVTAADSPPSLRSGSLAAELSAVSRHRRGLRRFSAASKQAVVCHARTPEDERRFLTDKPEGGLGRGRAPGAALITIADSCRRKEESK